MYAMPAYWVRKMMCVVYELDEEFYTLGMQEPSVYDGDAWWNLTYV
jgi:hypothetical protein